MKNFLFLLLLLPPSAQSQVFHFEDTSFTLIKTTNQSPAHWYIEIFSDVNVDTTLRWKARFNHVPSEWEINFDTQTHYEDTVVHGDSADFILWPDPAFPQKLIIGAKLNGTPANCSVLFDVYSPEDPSQFQTIVFNFIVSIDDAGLSEESIPFVQENGKLLFTPEYYGNYYSIYDVNGRELLVGIVSNEAIQRPQSTSPLFLLLEGNSEIKRFRLPE